MYKTVAGLYLAVTLLPLTGCFSSDTLIQVKPDGSGKIIQTTLINTALLEQLKAMMGQVANQMGGQDQINGDPQLENLLSEKESRANAKKLGNGVRFLSSRRLETEESIGLEAIYAFPDITQLHINQKPAPPGGQQMGIAGPAEHATFRFTTLPNGHSLVTAIFPRMQAKSTSQSPPPGHTRKEAQPISSAAELERLKMMFKGLKMSLAIEVQGDIIATSSPYCNGSKVTLLEMDFEELLSDASTLQQVPTISGQSLEDIKQLLQGMKGFKVNLDPEVSIEFSPHARSHLVPEP